jgi:hypothetical protein
MWRRAISANSAAVYRPQLATNSLVGRVHGEVERVIGVLAGLRVGHHHGLALPGGDRERRLDHALDPERDARPHRPARRTTPRPRAD